jgi:hypothetical protein
MGASLNRAKRAQFSPIRKPRSPAVSSRPLATTRSSPGNREWFAGLGEGWAPGLDTVFRIILEGALAERPLLADLVAETGARPVILRAKTLGGSCSAVATILCRRLHPTLWRRSNAILCKGARVWRSSATPNLPLGRHHKGRAQRPL